MLPELRPNNTIGYIRLGCCLLSFIACLWAICHLCCKSGRVRVQVFWTQLMALVFADLLLSVEIIWLSVTLSPFFWHGEITSTVFWSFFLEVQIALGVAGACRGWTFCARALRYMIFAGLLVAVGFAYLDSWLIAMNAMNEDQDSDFYSRAHAFLWCSVIVICLLINIGAYVGARIGAKRSPLIVRRRIMMRGISYALNFFIAVLPNLALDALIAGKVVQIDRTEVPDDTSVHGWALVETICGFLYCLNGAFNVGTYVLWMLWDEYIEARIVIGGDIADLEQTLQLNGYFNLCENAAQEARDVADAISQAQSVRQGGSQSPAAPAPASSEMAVKQ